MPRVETIGSVVGLQGALDDRLRLSSSRRFSPRPVKSSPVALFESTEAWAGGTANTTEAYIGFGRQSRLLTSVNAVNADSNLALAAPFVWDFAAFPQHEILYYVDDVMKLDASQGLMAFAAINVGFTRYFQTYLGNAGHPPVVNGWNVLRVTKSEWSAGSGATDADWANINNLRIRAKSITGQTVNVYVAAWRVVKPRGIVILNHDDGRIGMNTAWAIEQKHGLRSSNFVLSANVGTATYQTWDDLWSGYCNGHDIGNHTWSHLRLSTLDAASKTAEVQKGYNALIGRGFTRSARFFAAPFGEYSADITTAVSAFHRMNRTGAADTTGAGFKYPVAFEHGASSNCYASLDVNNVGTPDIATVKAAVTAAASSGKMLSLLTHDIGATADLYTITSAAYDALCSHIAASDVDCMTWSEYFDNAAPSVSAPLLPVEQRLTLTPTGTLTVDRTV